MAKEKYQGFEVFYEKGFSNVEKEKNATYYSRQEKDQQTSQMDMYHVMDGVDFMYTHFNSKSCVETSYTPEALGILELNHCRQGRFACSVQDEYIFLGQGEIEVNILGINRIQPEFPLGYYEGLTFIIDVDKFCQSIQSVFPDVALSIQSIQKQLNQGLGASLIRPNEQLNSIFCELYEIDARKSIDYIKVKILEIILLLQTMPYQRNHKKMYFQRKDFEKIKELRQYAIERLSIRIPFDDLVQQFHLSSTFAKQAFKEVYGMPYYTYMKQYRIHRALHNLQDDSLSIRDISSNLGYENASKFSNAFKKIIGVSPTEYRKNNIHIQHLDILDVEIEDD